MGLYRNKKNGSFQTFTDEEFAQMKRSPIPGNEQKTYGSLYELVKQSDVMMESANVQVPVELKKFSAAKVAPELNEPTGTTVAKPARNNSRKIESDGN